MVNRVSVTWWIEEPIIIVPTVTVGGGYCHLAEIRGYRTILYIRRWWWLVVSLDRTVLAVVINLLPSVLWLWWSWTNELSLLVEHVPDEHAYFRRPQHIRT